MKKFPIVILIFAIALTFAACSGTDAEYTKENVKGGFARGMVSDGEYFSPYTGLKFQKPDEMVFSEEETLASLSNLSLEDWKSISFAESINSCERLYDMRAINPSTGEDICVYYENTLLSTGNKLTAEEYIGLLHTTKGNMSFSSLYERQICGATFECIDGTTVANGLEISQTYCAKEQEDVTVVVVFTAESHRNVESLIGLFKS